VYARSEIAVAAGARDIWAVLAQIEEWPTWHPGVRDAAVEGDLEARTRFQWAAGPSTYTCVLTQVDAPRSITWRGRSMGLAHQCSWRLEERSGRCLVRAELTITGILARLFARRLRPWSQRELDTWMQLLKLETEARISEGDEVDDGHVPKRRRSPLP